MNDKLLHFLAGIFIVGFCYLLLPNIEIAFFIAIGFGFGKEVYDYFHPKSHSAEFMDLLATAYGALIAASLIQFLS